MKRRVILGGLILALLVATATAAVGAEDPVAGSGPGGAMLTSASRPVTATGRYRVVVTLVGGIREVAAVYVPGKVERSVHLRPHFTAKTTYTLALKASSRVITVRAATPIPGVVLRVTLDLQTNGSDASSGVTKGATGASGATSRSSSSGETTAATSAATAPLGATGSTTAAAAPPAAPTPPPQAPDPYTKLLLNDEFAGADGASPDSDGADLTASVDDGTCGPGTVNTNTASLANAHLDGHGDLAITALANGSGAYPYTSAQLESAFTSEYGSVQARIELPPGQGLCSQFWLDGAPTVGDPPVSTPCVWPGCGELDIDESPSFVGSQYPDYPPFSIFTLHGPISATTANQQWEFDQPNGASIGDPTDGFHTYGIIWSPDSITWTLDGVAYASANEATIDAYVAANDPGSLPTWEFDEHNFFVILDLAVGGWPGAPPSGTSGEFPATMLVNWVRWYGCQTGTPQNGCT